jgi:hypothetical protein
MTTSLQIEMAKNFLIDIKKNYENLEEIDAMGILDSLGVCGLSFTVGDDASVAFLTELGATPIISDWEQF